MKKTTKYVQQQSTLKLGEQLICEYSFPHLQLNAEYESLDCIQSAIYQQAYNADCEGLDALYQQYDVLEGTLNGIEYTCKICSASLEFILTGAGAFQLIKLQPNHRHLLSCLTEVEKRYMQLFGGQISKIPQQELQLQMQNTPMEIQETGVQQHQQQPFQTIRQNKGSLRNSKASNTHNSKGQQNLSQPLQINPPLSEILPKPIQQPVNLDKEFKLLVQSGYCVVVRRGPKKTGRQPLVIVLASPIMRSVYECYDDSIGIQILPCKMKDFQYLKLTYKLLVVYIFDSNMRPRIATIALIGSDKMSYLYTVFKSLFKIHKSKFVAITTDFSSIITKTLEVMKDVGYCDAIHLLDPTVFYEQVDSILGTEQTPKTKTARNLVKQIIEENYQNKAYQLMKQLDLLGIQNGSCKQLVDYITTVKDKICRWSLPQKFIGLHFSGRNEIRKHVERELSPIESLEQLIHKLISLQQQRLSLNQDNTSQFTEKLEEILDDVRLTNVRCELQSNIFSLFMRNYMKQFAETDCLIVEAQFEKEVIVPEGKSKFVVDMSLKQCTCNEPQKIGLPCSHMLAVAMKVPTITYTSLIHKRWKRYILDFTGMHMRSKHTNKHPNRHNYS